MLRLWHLHLGGLAGNTKTERTRRRHDLDIAAFPAYDQRQLESIAWPLGELPKRNRNCERIIDVPARLGGRLRKRIDDLRHRDGGALLTRRDADHERRLETALAQRGRGHRKIEAAATLGRRRSGAVDHEPDAVRVELLAGPRTGV